jgi:hypothetical protein
MSDVSIQLHDPRFEQQNGSRAAELKITFFLSTLARAALALVLHHAPNTGRSHIYVNDIPEIARMQHTVFALVFAENRQLTLR